ncbi:MAG: thiamine pyrophosphate-dependent dehydrogenase E1 component subunit alpha [Candidatus Omnitrophica bacterium]|nr:thiamine pyrophosphate-dependent dehydrogenase E1 component subunit alpha [Candidatus Omnitrophota bacterium]
MNQTTRKKLFLSMLKIRRVEEQVVSVYGQKQMRTPTHLSIGQEAVASGVCANLTKKDQVFASHRCHAAFLARGGSVDQFFLELCGRKNGVNQGRGGSAHLSDASKGFFSSPILGGMVPVATGAALSFKLNKTKNVAVVFSGDAGLEEGVFAESVNFALLKKLPIVFICENNLYSTNTHIRYRQPNSPIFKRVTELLKPKQINGNDVEKVYVDAKKAVDSCRRGKGPVFLECLTYRFREHVGPLYDYNIGYRTKKEVFDWEKRCPLSLYKRKILKLKIMSKKSVELTDKKIMNEAENSYAKALKGSWPTEKDLMTGVY